ncbi:hypothetical protein [Acidianus sulfidivorans]|nr:hypothetical protein [Acidianus sulfidivorans]
MQAQVLDPCVEQCLKSDGSWKFVSVAECLSRCRSLNITKPV